MLLTIDELVDAGKILEIDPSAIANRVLMRGADARQPQASELTVQQVRCSGVGLVVSTMVVYSYQFCYSIAFGGRVKV